MPVVEVHLSNIDEREEWRRASVDRGRRRAPRLGKGPDGYKRGARLAHRSKRHERPRRAAARRARPTRRGAFLVTNPVNVRYLTGFESSNAAVLVDDDARPVSRTAATSRPRARSRESRSSDAERDFVRRSRDAPGRARRGRRSRSRRTTSPSRSTRALAGGRRRRSCRRSGVVEAPPRGQGGRRARRGPPRRARR